MFFDHYQASIIKCKPAYWNIGIHRRANLRLLNKEYWLANDPWFTLSRNHVQKCLIFIAAKQGLYQKINSGGLANESIFAIILQTFKELNKEKTYINESSTVADWSRMSSPTSPYLFKDILHKDTDIQIIKQLLKDNKYAMFLRKVNHNFPDDILLEIMKEDFGHTYDILHNQFKKKNKLYNYKLIFAIFPFLLFLVLCYYFYK